MQRYLGDNIYQNNYPIGLFKFEYSNPSKPKPSSFASSSIHDEKVVHLSDYKKRIFIEFLSNLLDETCYPTKYIFQNYIEETYGYRDILELKVSDKKISANDLINKLPKALQILIYFIAFQVGMNFLGIDLTALAVFSGALGIGIGFGLQKITSNFISGIIILFEKTVQNDDLIELNDGTLGFIRNTGSRASLIETYDGKEVMVPNEDLITNRVINYTHSNKKARITINIGVSYDCDIKKAQELILEAASEHPKTAKEPEPLCFLREFADSSVNFLLLFWINDVIDGRYGPQSDVLFSIWEKFKENNIEIPYPQRDIHIKESLSK